MIPMPRRDGPARSDQEPLICVMVIPEAPGLKTFRFRPASGAPFDFKAGRFLKLELSDGKYLFILACSGVTPMASMTGTLFERGEQPDICFIQCAKHPVDLIFRKCLEYMTSRLSGLNPHFVVMANDPYEVWGGYRGTLNQLMLGLMCSDYLERDVFCCGPEGIMSNARDILNSLNFGMSRYHQESFGAVPVEQPEVFEDVVPDKNIAEGYILACCSHPIGNVTIEA